MVAARLQIRLEIKRLNRQTKIRLIIQIIHYHLDRLVELWALGVVVPLFLLLNQTKKMEMVEGAFK